MRGIKLVPNIPYTLPEIEDLTDLLPRHKTKVYPMRTIEDIDTITVHHMASEAPLFNQAAYHVNGRGWAGMGYSMVVSDGKLFQTNNLLSITNHSSGHNPHSIAISIRGDLSKRPMTSVERELLYAGILTLKHYLPHIKYVVGHGEQGRTSCPATSMNQIRADIMALEQKLIFENSAAHSKETAFKIANQLMYLYRMAEGKLPDGSVSTEGQQKWSQEMLLRLYPFMQENKLFG